MTPIVLYVALVAAAGWLVERFARPGPRIRAGLYALSLATLCSAWTFFGAVGDAVEGRWLFVASALGPALAITVGYPVWRKLAIVCRQENVVSLADFLAARYGKSRTLGILCATTAAVGALPYIALQANILADALAFAAPVSGVGSGAGSLLVVALALVPIAFAVRRSSLTRFNVGFAAVLAVQAGVKLVALLCVAGLALALLHADPGAAAAVRATPPLVPAIDGAFVTLTVLGALTAFTLPRQFHLGFVMVGDVGDTRAARWVLPAYLALWVAAALVVAAAARAGLSLADAPRSMQVLALPVAHGGGPLLLVTLIGGISAGAAVMAVETVATSAMVSNEIVLPLLARLGRSRLVSTDLNRRIVLIRRSTIVLIAWLAWLYYRATRGLETPAALGQSALSAFAQFLPALIGGLYWRRGHRDGAIAGIAAGMLLWLATVAGPAVMASASPPAHGGSFLWPVADDRSTELAIVLSLSVNALVYVVMSLLAKPRLVDTIQTMSFVGPDERVAPRDEQPIGPRMADMRRLLSRFMGSEDADKAMLDLRGDGDAPPDDGDAVTPSDARLVEKVLAGVIGASSARNVVAYTMASGRRSASDVGRILDEAAHAVQFNRELLQTTLESLAEGIGVIDRDMRMVAWNAPFLDMLRLADTHVYVGKPLAELLGRGRSAAEVAMRPRLVEVSHQVFRRSATRDEWPLDDGRTLSIVGKPLSGGEYLLTLTDITELRAAELVLAQDKEGLERRVRDRTRELNDAMAALAEATAVAERVSNAQKRFVAAASHDLVQPLHAARLFIGNVLPTLEESPIAHDMLRRADQAVEAAHGMMGALLNLSRLETGTKAPSIDTVSADRLLQSLATEFAAEAQSRGIGLIIRPTALWVRTDRDLLRSMLQNLIGNALRYTPRGRVLVAVRRAGDRARFEVRDTGVGIGSDQVAEAFAEYSRLPEGSSLGGGAGLGLAIVARLADVLDHPVGVRSRPGQGSVFSFTVPVAAPPPPLLVPAPDATPIDRMRILFIDDERDVLIGTRALLERWGATVDALPSVEDVPSAAGPWDVVIADNRLPGESGLDFLRRMAGQCSRRILLTATAEEGWEATLAEEDIALLRKPASPLALRALLSERA